MAGHTDRYPTVRARYILGIDGTERGIVRTAVKLD